MENWSPSLVASTPSPTEDFHLTRLLSRMVTKTAQQDPAVRDGLRADHAEDMNALIAVSAAHIPTFATTYCHY